MKAKKVFLLLSLIMFLSYYKAALASDCKKPEIKTDDIFVQDYEL